MPLLGRFSPSITRNYPKSSDPHRNIGWNASLRLIPKSVGKTTDLFDVELTTTGQGQRQIEHESSSMTVHQLASVREGVLEVWFKGGIGQLLSDKNPY